MANDGQIVFEVTADGSRAIADIKDITSTIKQEAGKWDDAAKQSTDNMEQSFSGMLKKIVAGFSDVKIGQALLNIGKDALEAASALEEVQNVVDVTFGDNAGKIETWAKNAGTQFGLTETQAKKFTSTIGAMLKSSGMGGNQITQISTDLAGLAADMASFYNLDFEEAFSKIRSGISGQTMPLKELGIDMSVATLNAFALQQGLTKTFDQMSQSEQTMLRYQYLMQATADAQGDFSRTSDGYANSIRRAETAVEGIKTQLGQLLIGPAAEALTWVNDFLAKITQTPTTTVLDDFEKIDIDTEKKLAEIEKIASEARALTDELEAIGGSKAELAGSKVQQIADGFASINLDQGKAGVVRDFIATLSSDIETLAGLQGTDAEGAKKWLEEIGTAADSLDPADAEGWSKLIASIKEGLPGLENTEFGAAFFTALGDQFENVGDKTSVLEWALDTLGEKTNRTKEEQDLWLETCKRLVKTIPGLSSIINTETGEIKGGTQAVKDYIKAWEDGRTKLVLLGALEEKEAALSSRFSDLPGLQLDMALAQRRVRKSYEQLKALYEKYGLQLGFDKDGKVYRNFNDVYGLTPEQKAELQRETDYFEQLNNEADDATAAYNLQKDALEEAKQALIEYRQAIEEQYPDAVDKAIAETAEWSDEAKENAQTLINAAQTSLKALSDYAQGVRDAVAKNVDSVIKGFGKVGKAADKEREKSSEYAKEEAEALKKYGSSIGKAYKNADGSVNLQKMQANYDKLTKKEKEAYNELAKIHNKQIEVNKELDAYSASGMKGNLQSQIDYMQEYMDNLDKARQMGLSNELLASLSDGSTESAEYLAALVSGGAETAKEIDALYKQMEEKKKAFTDELTGQQLTADAVYQKMAAEAKAAVEALDLEGEAKDNAGKTVAGMAQGIAEHVPEVQTAVDSIVAELNRLNGWGVNIDLGTFGSFRFNVSTTNPVDGEHETGLNFVPFDGYLASLHAGEGILTAEENRIWQRFKDGGNTFDYDTMGGVLRDNVKAGGNVYLDGRVVGNVISDQQGKSYRQLQRSGWQG